MGIDPFGKRLFLYMLSFNCESLDAAPFKESRGRIASVVFELVVLNDFVVGNGVPADPDADVCCHLEICKCCLTTFSILQQAQSCLCKQACL